MRLSSRWQFYSTTFLVPAQFTDGPFTSPGAAAHCRRKSLERTDVLGAAEAAETGKGMNRPPERLLPAAAFATDRIRYRGAVVESRLARGGAFVRQSQAVEC